MIKFNCIIHKETGTVINYLDWLKMYSCDNGMELGKHCYHNEQMLFSDDFEIIYNSEFTTDELKKIYNIFFNYSDSCENLEIKKKISNMINQRVEKPKHSPSRMMYEALKEAMEGKE